MSQNPLYFSYRDELYHYGVLGMRWGVRNYQPYSTVPRESGKRGKEIGLAKRRTLGQAIKDYRTKKKRKKSLEKAREIRKQKKIEADEIKKKIDEAVGKGDAAAIKELMPRMTNEQFANALQRVQFADQMQRSKDAKFNETFNKVLKVSTTVGNIADSASKIYKVAEPFIKDSQNKKIKELSDQLSKANEALKGLSDTTKAVDEAVSPLPEDSGAKKKFNKAVKAIGKETAKQAKKRLKEEAQKRNQQMHDEWQKKHDQEVAEQNAAKQKAKEEAQKRNQQMHDEWQKKAEYEKKINDAVRGASKETSKNMKANDRDRYKQYQDLARRWEAEEAKKANSTFNTPLNEIVVSSSSYGSPKALTKSVDTSAYSPYNRSLNDISIPPSRASTINNIVKSLPSTPVYLLEKKDY